MIVHAFPGLHARDALGSVAPREDSLPPGSFLTHLGRTALVHAFRALGVGSGSDVLLPAFHCGVEVHAVRHVGASATFYPVSASLGVDLDAVLSRIGPGTRAVVLTHFYGIEQPAQDLARHCDARGIALIEDCAHVFAGSGSDPGLPGSSGHAAIFSLPKFLPVPDGGVLRFRGGLWPAGSAPPDLRPPPRLPILRRSVRLALMGMDRDHPRVSSLIHRRILAPARWLLGSGGRGVSPEAGAGAPYDPASSDFCGAAVAWAASGITRRLLARADWVGIASSRRHNYDYLSDSIAGIPGIDRFQRELPTRMVPLVLPVRVQQRPRVESHLAASGVSVYRFGAGIEAATHPEGPPELRRLREEILGLPIHQDLGSRELDHVAAALRRSVASASPRTLPELT